MNRAELDYVFDVMLDWDLSEDRMDLCHTITEQCVYHAMRLSRQDALRTGETRVVHPTHILEIVKMDVEAMLADPDFLENAKTAAREREAAEEKAIQTFHDEAYVSCLMFAFNIS